MVWALEVWTATNQEAFGVWQELVDPKPSGSWELLIVFRIGSWVLSPFFLTRRGTVFEEEGLEAVDFWLSSVEVGADSASWPALLAAEGGPWCGRLAWESLNELLADYFFGILEGTQTQLWKAVSCRLSDVNLFGCPHFLPAMAGISFVLYSYRSSMVAMASLFGPLAFRKWAGAIDQSADRRKTWEATQLLWRLPALWSDFCVW